MKQDYYGFFLPSTIRDRRAAISAIVAGVVANGLLTVLMGFACVVWILREGSKARMTWTLLAVTVLLVIATVATWKRVLFGPVMGIAIALAVVIWQVLIGQTAVAVILAVPLVGGSWTAARHSGT
jgi:hypothetical protein